MSDSDDFDVSSVSTDSFFSSDSSMHCPSPRRFVDLITDKLKSMKCAKKGKRQEYELPVGQKNNAYSDSDEYSSESDDAKVQASLLKNKLDLMNAAKDSEENRKERIGKNVTFSDLQEAGCSDKKIKRNNADVPSTSRAVQDLPSTSSAAKLFQDQNVEVEKKPDQGTLGHLLLKSAQSIFVLNFPDLSKLFENVGEESAQCKNTNKILTQADVHSTAERSNSPINEGNAVSSLDSTTRGKLKVHETGRVTISFGEKVFEMSQDISLLEHEVVRVELDEATQTGTMKSLGMAQHYIDVLPQMEKYDNSDIVDNHEGNENEDTPYEKKHKVGDVDAVDENDIDEIDDKHGGMRNDAKKESVIVKEDTPDEKKQKSEAVDAVDDSDIAEIDYKHEGIANDAKKQGVNDEIDLPVAKYLKMEGKSDSDELDDKFEGMVNNAKEEGVNDNIKIPDEEYLKIEETDSDSDEVDDKDEEMINEAKKEGVTRKIDMPGVKYIKLEEDYGNDIDEAYDKHVGIVNDAKEGMNEEVSKAEGKQQKLRKAHSNDETGQYKPDGKKTKYAKRELDSL